MNTPILILHSRLLVSQTLVNYLTGIGYHAYAGGPGVEDAVLTARQTPPNIALVDVDFDSGNGFDVAHLLLMENLQTRVILSVPAKPIYLEMAIQTDASGYLPPEFDLPELDTCLQFVQNRFRYVSPVFAELLRLPLPVVDTAIAAQLQQLTPRQKEFLRLVCTGLFQKEIADAMGITKETVVSYKKDLTRKLHLDSRRDLRYFLAPYSHLLGCLVNPLKRGCLPPSLGG